VDEGDVAPGAETATKKQTSGDATIPRQRAILICPFDHGSAINVCRQVVQPDETMIRYGKC
jgi:hypothetical protein